MFDAIVTLVFSLPYVFLPAILLFSRPGDRRIGPRAFLGGISLVYGIFMLSLVPLVFAFGTFIGWAWAGDPPDRGSTISYFTDWRALGIYALAALFIATGVGVVGERRWDRIAAIVCLVGFATYTFFTRT